MIADMINNKKLNPVVTELLIRGRKLNISFAFITQSYFKVPKLYTFFIMKISNKKEVQQIALNHSSDIDFKDFIKIYKKCTAEPYSSLVNDRTLPSDNPLRFTKSILEHTSTNKYITWSWLLMIKLETKSYSMDKRIENREAAKRSALSSGKINKYEYLTGENILPSNQKQIIEQGEFTYSPLGKTFEKQTKTIEDQGKKQADTLNTLKPK